MAGYFDKLIQSYGPAASRPEPNLPWMPAPEDEAPSPEVPPPPNQVEMSAPHPAGPVPESQPASFSHLADAPPQVSDDIPPPPLLDPDAPDSASKSPEPELSERHIIERIIDPLPEPAQPDAVQAEKPPDRVTQIQNMHETHLHVEETHLHPPAPTTGPSDDEAGAAMLPAAKLDEPASPLPRQPDARPDFLEQLEAHLAKAFKSAQPAEQNPIPVPIDTADFEPETALPLRRLETETVHEVTREVIKEIHHHHETRVEAPPKRAPRTAAEASQIGQIRFASSWGRSGGM